MKLCDRCFQSGEYKPGTQEIVTSTDETFDLCETCYNGLRKYISEHPDKPDKPQKAKKKRN